MTDKILWDAEMPTDDPEFIPIIRAVPGHTHRLVAVSAGIERVRVHYLPPPMGGAKGRTVACIGKENGCWCATFPLKREWYGYLGAYDPNGGHLYLAELTVQAVRESNLDLTGQIISLRGLPFTMTRRGRTMFSPVRVVFEAPRPGMPEPPPDFDRRRALRRIWRMQG